MICVDSSVAAKWVLPEDHSEQALDLYQRATQAGREVVAPALLPIEVCNILRQRVRRGLLTSEDAGRALDRFLDFPVRLAAPSRPHGSALALADQYDLPAAYDAYYLSLARELGASIDRTSATGCTACADSGSGPNASTITSPVTLSSEGKDQSTMGSCTGKADNTSTLSVNGIDIDSTRPIISGTPTSGPVGNDGVNDWYNEQVSVAWTCADGTAANPADGASVTQSGILGACPANTTITGEGAGLTSSASISDKAGNTRTATTDPVNIDHTPPTTQITAPDGWNTWTNNDVVLGLTASDNLSGSASTYYTLDGGSP